MLEGEKSQNWGRIVTFLLLVFDNLLMFFDNFWILDWGIFGGRDSEADGRYWDKATVLGCNGRKQDR